MHCLMRDATEIKIEKSDADDIEDFILNMDNNGMHSNMAETSQDDMKLEIKNEPSDEN